ncbi:MAG: TolC family protein [Planctomycetes bacterium]|nr:TolC family protein [Planctomycetota bacterium]
MRTLTLALTLAAAAPLTAPADARDKADPPRKESVEESAKKVKELQKERTAVLQKLVDQATTQYESGRGSYEEVLEARLQLLQAELDVAEKPSDRVALYTKAVDALKAYEELAGAQVKAGRGTSAAVLKIKARRLEVEIQLEQTKIKDAKGGK